MSETHPDLPFADSILHPSDFSNESERAFAHALALALCQKASLTILNAGPGGKEKRWMEFPSVRGTLERWGLLDEGTARGGVSRELDVRVKKVSLKKRRPLPAVLDYMDDHPVDLIVLATEGREGLPRWMQPSMAEAIARGSETMTLFVPAAARGFVSAENGRLTLSRVVVPIGGQPDPRAAVVRASRIAAMSAVKPVEIVIFHAGTADELPAVSFPEYPFCTWSTVATPGDVVEGIVRTAEERSADLIVMATEGHDGILDALRGSVTEQVLRKAPCPLLAVPARPTLF